MPIRFLVAADKTFDIQYYVDVGNHWQIELTKPEFGDNQPTTWYVYEPDVELKTTVTLSVVSDTLFKLEPKLSSTLRSQQKVFVANGTEYALLAYLPAAGNHLKITLAGANLGPEQRNTWFVYKPDVKVAGDRLELRIVGDTLFKTQPKLSSELDAGDKVFVKKGTVFQLNSYGEIERNHIKVSLEEHSWVLNISPPGTLTFPIWKSTATLPAIARMIPVPGLSQRIRQIPASL